MGGGTTSYREMEETDLVVLWGSNARDAHPIFFHHVLKGIHNGAKLYAVDPREELVRPVGGRRGGHLQLHVGTDIPLANAVAREILAAGLENRSFIEHATSGFEELRRACVEPWTLERAEAVTGVPAAQIRELAHAYARADRAVICWTLGITEHHNAVDNVLALINLSLLTGHVGRYGSGVDPLRGQNNVQGGGDMGALPDRLPGFQHVENDELRAKFERAWGVPVPAQARLAPLRDVRGHGARRADGPLRDRREPGQLRGGPAPHHRAAAAASRPWSCRTCSSPPPPSWRTWCCRPPPAGASPRGR